jgi:hypothetical protein
VFQRVSKRQRLGSLGAVKRYYIWGLTLLFPLFRETELPNVLTIIGGLKLNPNIYAVILRCLWFCGYSWGCESLKNAKDRAKIASDLLVEYAQEQTTVALVGHGFFNILALLNNNVDIRNKK